MKKLALALVLAAPLCANGIHGVAWADDDALPFNPFEKAQKGDFAVHEGTLKAEGAGENKVHLSSNARVISVDGDDVVVREVTNEGKPTKTTFSTKKAPTLAQLLGLKDGKVTDVKVTDESRKLDDKKELACKKVTFTWTQAANKYEGTVWLSPEVKAGGVVALTLKGHEKGPNQGSAKGKDGEDKKTDLLVESSTKLEVTGFGTGDKSDWGEAPEGGDEGDDTPCQLPLDPFANAKKGAWAAYTIDVDAGGRAEKAVVNYEISSLKKKQKVKIDRSMSGARNDSEEIAFDLDDPIDPAQFVATMIKQRQNDLKPTTGGKVSDAKKTVGDKEFACKLLQFTLDDGRSKAKIKLWMSADVGATSVVAMEAKINEGGRNLKISMELGGYGDDDKVTWGKTAEKLGKKKKQEDDE